MSEWSRRLCEWPESTRERAGTTAPREPLCYVADRDPASRRTVSTALEQLNIEVVPFTEIAVMLEAVFRRSPDLIFVDLGVGAADADYAIRAFAGARIACPVQLMSAVNPVLIEKARRAGVRQGLNLLPVLGKPFRHAAVRHVVDDLGLRRDSLATRQLGLDDVLKKNWLELWHQPKINLRSKQLVGAEVFVRARHPEHGTLPPSCFLDNSSESDLLRLTGFVLVTALEHWQDFARVCPDIKIAINIPVAALTKLPIATIIKEVRPTAANWPGMSFELMEEDLIPSLSVVCDLAEELSPLGAGLAIDNCGAGYATLARIPQLPFCELKIDQSYVTGCDRDPVTAGICETIIDLAHRHKIVAAAQGIETAMELKTLVRMNCDIGQGYLFARPMSKDGLMQELQQRIDMRRNLQSPARNGRTSSIRASAE
jgi:EAL domain-containing protein (putative c-di-GMP-specific phosphodiesterase class I)